MKIHDTLSLFPPADENQLSSMRQMMVRGVLNNTIYVAKNPKTKITELVDGRARLALFGPKGVNQQTVAWDEAPAICYQLNSCSKPITIVQKACFHYAIFGEQITDTWFPERMLRKIGQVKRGDENLYTMLVRGELASIDSALNIIRNRRKAENEEPEGESGDGRADPKVLSREFYLKQIFETLDKALLKMQKINKYDIDDPDQVQHWADEIKDVATRIAEKAEDEANEAREEFNNSAFV